MNGPKSFVDTNILLYMYSDADAGKQKQATELFEQLASSGSILVSTQVIQEFYVAATRKLRLPQSTLRILTESLLELPLVIVAPTHVRSAMDNQVRFQISFWDALILAAAEAGGAEVLYTEDLNHGQRFGAVQAHNPFADSAA